MIERNIDSAKVMLSGRWKSKTMLTKYSKKIQAKRSGMAELSQQLGWSQEHEDHSMSRTIEPLDDKTGQKNTDGQRIPD